MSDMMKAVRLHGFGGPELLRYEEAPRPQLKAGEVLERVHAAGINPHPVIDTIGGENAGRVLRTLRRGDALFPVFPPGFHGAE